MNHHRTNRHEIAEKSRRIYAGTGVSRSTRQRIQVMIQRDERGRGEVLLTLRAYRRNITPNLQLEFRSQRSHCFLKRRNTLVIVFEYEDRFHPPAPLKPR